MIALASSSPIVRSDVFGLAIAGLTIALLCAAQVMELSDRKVRATRIISVVAAVLCVVVAGLVVARFAVLG